MGNSQANVKLTEAKVVFASGNAFPYSLAAELTRKELEAAGCKAKLRIVVCDPKNVVEHLSDADVLIPFDAVVTAGVIARAPILKLIMQFGNDVSNVDVTAATEAGIDVSRIKSNECGIAESCAEFAVYLALSLIFKQSASNGEGNQLRSTLCGKNAIIFGGGAVASCLGLRLKGLGCNVMPVTQHHPENYKYLPDADILFLCLSRTQVTAELVNAELLSAMKNGIHIVDISRVRMC
jgi:phosphoglycerate dehydrogenase-like enzyme